MDFDDAEFELELKNDFLQEAAEMLEACEQAFLSLEDDSSDKENSIDEIFRLAHSLKGTSSAVGLSPIADFTHELENLILEIKNGKIAVTEVVVTVLLESNDFLIQMVAGLKEDLDRVFDDGSLKARIVELLNGKQTLSTDAQPQEEPAAEPQVEAQAVTASDITVEELSVKPIEVKQKKKARN